MERSSTLACSKQRSMIIKSYVLRGGRMTAAQERCYNLLKNQFCIPLQDKNIDTANIFKNDMPLVVEIGFGSGLATELMAKYNPLKNYLGIEVFKSGIGKLLWRIEQNSLTNIRIIEGDAQLILHDMIADNSVACFNIFFPDPWPKKRHHKRRLVQRPFTNMLAAKLVDGGFVHFASDIEDYAEFALAELSNTDGLQNCFDNYAPPELIRIPAAEPRTQNKARAEGVFALTESCTPGLIPSVSPHSLARETSSVQRLLNPTARIKLAADCKEQRYAYSKVIDDKILRRPKTKFEERAINAQRQIFDVVFKK
ncbi:MAG: hypothetical protein Ta2B_21590 [Termitinemataceae bacterium]|nr:MAG: hypothetical protein Ta2B_21590 [Termitinemataceae bacterium]